MKSLDSQQTDLQEFYSTMNSDNPELQNERAYWQYYYNCIDLIVHLEESPMEKYDELSEKTLFWDEIIDKYDSLNKRIWRAKLQIRFTIDKLKPSLFSFYFSLIKFFKI